MGRWLCGLLHKTTGTALCRVRAGTFCRQKKSMTHERSRVENQSDAQQQQGQAKTHVFQRAWSRGRMPIGGKLGNGSPSTCHASHLGHHAVLQAAHLQLLLCYLERLQPSIRQQHIAVSTAQRSTARPLCPTRNKTLAPVGWLPSAAAPLAGSTVSQCLGSAAGCLQSAAATATATAVWQSVACVTGAPQVHPLCCSRLAASHQTWPPAHAVCRRGCRTV